jgi:hypothetical protein
MFFIPNGDTYFKPGVAGRRAAATPGKSHPKTDNPKRGCVRAEGICGHGHNTFGVGIVGLSRPGVGFTALYQPRA